MPPISVHGSRVTAFIFLALVVERTRFDVWLTFWNSSAFLDGVGSATARNYQPPVDLVTPSRISRVSPWSLKSTEL
jgi:hypothetical protein